MQVWPPKKIEIDKTKAIEEAKKLEVLAADALHCRFESRHKRVLRHLIKTMPVLRQALNHTLMPVDVHELLDVAGAPFADERDALARLTKVVDLATGEHSAGAKINTRLRTGDYEHYGCPMNSRLADYSSRIGYRGTSWVYKGPAGEKLAAFVNRIQGFEERITKGIQIKSIYDALDNADVPQHRSGDLFKRIIMIGATARDVQARLDAENAPPKADRRRKVLVSAPRL
ncbi:MAG: hypothetical protein Alpg2KO_31920 [Alphaproteobacteria bacterium]